MEAAVAEGWLHTYGYLDNAHVAALYERALFVVLPSIYEGFGLPAVEAMSAGVPLVASDIPVLREIAGEAALYVAPDDIEAWAATC
ncbi:MAG: glycosyltransferase family 4 protein, partial [Thermoanaerobaculia bacterium]|nr:glycosyltransferase family 4 protein [Thermoanaerobaculia bacterium]